MSNNLNSSEEDPLKSTTNDPGVIRCICGFEHDDGFTIQCEQCLVWQHAVCVEIQFENVPDSYLCEKCLPRPLDIEKAKQTQKTNLEGNHKSNSRQNINENRKQKQKQKGRKNSHNKKKALISRKNSKSEISKPTQLVNFEHINENFLSKNVKIYLQQLLDENNYLGNQKNSPNKVKNYTHLNEQGIIKFEPDPGVTLPMVVVKKINSDNKTISTAQLNNTAIFSKNLIKNTQYIGEFKGQILTHEEYAYDQTKYLKQIGLPLPFIFFCEGTNFAIDNQKAGNSFRFIRNSCENNALIAPYCDKRNQISFGLFAHEEILIDEEITIPWNIDDDVIPNSLIVNKDIKNTNFQSIVKDKIQLIIDNYIKSHSNIEESIRKLSDIDGAIKLLRKCACDRGITCKFNRLIKTTKKLWAEKLALICKTSVSNSPNSMLEFNEETTSLSLNYSQNNITTGFKTNNTTPVKLFIETNPEIKLAINSLMKRGLRKFITYKYKKYCIKHKQKVISENQSPIKQNSILNGASKDIVSPNKAKVLKNQNSNGPNVKTKSPTKFLDPGLKKITKTTTDKSLDSFKKPKETKSNTNESPHYTKPYTYPEKIKKIDKPPSNNSNNNTTSTVVTENKTRPKSRSISVYKDDKNQKKKITLQEYLAQINAADTKKDSPKSNNESNINSLPLLSSSKTKKENLVTALKNKTKLENKISETNIENTHISSSFSIKPVSVMPYIEENLSKENTNLLEQNRNLPTSLIEKNNIERIDKATNKVTEGLTRNQNSILNDTITKNHSSNQKDFLEVKQKTKSGLNNNNNFSDDPNNNFEKPLKMSDSKNPTTNDNLKIENHDVTKKPPSTETEIKIKKEVEVNIKERKKESINNNTRPASSSSSFIKKNLESTEKGDERKNSNPIPETIKFKNGKACSDNDTKEKSVYVENDYERKNSNQYYHHYYRDHDKYSERSNESYKNDHKHNTSNNGSTYNNGDSQPEREKKTSITSNNNSSYYENHYHNHNRDDYHKRTSSNSNSVPNTSGSGYYKSTSNKYNDYYTHTGGYTYSKNKQDNSTSSSRYYEERSKSYYHSSNNDKTYDKDHKHYKSSSSLYASEKRESKYGYLSQPNRGDISSLLTSSCETKSNKNEHKEDHDNIGSSSHYHYSSSKNNNYRNTSPSQHHTTTNTTSKHIKYRDKTNNNVLSSNGNNSHYYDKRNVSSITYKENNNNTTSSAFSSSKTGRD